MMEWCAWDAIGTLLGCAVDWMRRMARPRKRVCLEDGLRLDLNQLVRAGILVSGAVRSRTTYWQQSRNLVGVAVITADLTDLACPQIRIVMRGLNQIIELIGQERPFGGNQWYF